MDVDERNIAKVMRESVKDAAKPRIFYDYRKMLDECHKDLDVVLIATPDHHHAPAAIRAIHYGKHVFCQKPLGHNIAECYALAKAAQEKKVLTQMGNQGYCGEPIRRVAEYIAAGAIGTVTESHTLLDRNFGGTGGRPPSKPVPPGLHWDEWVGPAPYRDYHEGLHPFSWRNWKAFGTGTIGDMACHRLAYPFMALRLWELKTFTVECLNTKGGSDEKYPPDNVVCYHIPARDSFPACKCYVYDHQELRPEVMKELEKKYAIRWTEVPLFVGTKGYLSNPPHPRVGAPEVPGPAQDAAACQGRRPDRRPLRLHPHRGHARFQFHRRGQSAHGDGLDGAPCPVRRHRREDRVGRREDGMHQPAGVQQVPSARISQRMGTIAYPGKGPLWHNR